MRTHTGVRIVSCLSFFGEPLLEMEESGRLCLEILAHSSHEMMIHLWKHLVYLQKNNAKLLVLFL